MKNAMILIPTLALMGCAGYRQPESVAEKMARFTPRNQNPNTVPSYSKNPPFTSFKKSGRRGPASAKVEKKKTPSTKRLYFLSLYGQYLKMGQYLQHSEVKELNHCPSFHSTFVDFKQNLGHHNKLSFNFSKRVSQINNLDERAPQKFPELSLPMTNGGPTFYDILKEHGPQHYPNFFENALAFHLVKTYKEIEELCDSGTSENYYNYENLTRHIGRKGKSFTRSKDAFSAYMKTTLFSNTALLKSLEKSTNKGRIPASATGAHQYEREVIEQLDAVWSENYFSQVGRP